MESRYELLVSVGYKHGYFSGRKFDRISTEPTHATRETLIRNGLLFNLSPTGFRILFDTRWGGSTRERKDVLKDKPDLLFQLTLTDPDFYHYTAMDPGNITRSFVYLSNVSIEGEQHPSAGLLHSGEFVTENDSVCFGKLPQHFFGKPFGWLQLAVDLQLKDAYEALWPGRSVYWNYIVVSRHLRELNKPAIIDSVTKQQAFSGPEPILLPDNRPALSFVSGIPIPFQAAEKKVFQLVENFEKDSGRYKVVLSALPRADTRIISAAIDRKSEPGKEDAGAIEIKKTKEYYSEIFIY